MSLNPLGASGSLRAASASPKGRRPRSSDTPIAFATRSGVPNRLPSTGMVWPTGRSNRIAGTAGAQHAVAQRRHLQVRGHRLGNAAQLAGGLELGHEVAQVAVAHGQLCEGWAAGMPSQRRDSTCCTSSRSSTRATLPSTMSAMVCGRV